MKSGSGLDSPRHRVRAGAASLSTPSLDLRPSRLQDLGALYRLWTAAAVRRFLFDGRMLGLDEARGFLERSAASFAEHGFGIWLVFERGRPELAGFAGLLGRAEGAPSLVYGIRPDLVGRGLASEAARAVLDHALGALRLPCVAEDVDEPNAASVRVLEKLGLVRVRRAEASGRPVLYYEISTPPDPEPVNGSANR
jgi:RimJ/RimL family protein N-acetyltransferase